jgi:hypothetical protein
MPRTFQKRMRYFAWFLHWIYQKELFRTASVASMTASKSLVLLRKFIGTLPKQTACLMHGFLSFSKIHALTKLVHPRCFQPALQPAGHYGQAERGQ